MNRHQMCKAVIPDGFIEAYGFGHGDGWYVELRHDFYGNLHKLLIGLGAIGPVEHLDFRGRFYYSIWSEANSFRLVRYLCRLAHCHLGREGKAYRETLTFFTGKSLESDRLDVPCLTIQDEKTYLQISESLYDSLGLNAMFGFNPEPDLIIPFPDLAIRDAGARRAA